MSIDEYVVAFSEKMEFALHLIPNDMAKIDKFATGLPSDYSVAVRTATTFQSAVWAAKYVENQLKEKASERAIVGEKRRFDGPSGSNKKMRFSKFGSNNNKSRGKDGGKWCEKCKKKHFGKCDEVTCFKCGKTGHYASNFSSTKRVCFECGEEGNFKSDCPKNGGAPKKVVQPKPNGRFHTMTLEEAKEETNVASGTFLVNNLSTNILFDSGANFSYIAHDL